jgi:hypothetical protein
MITIKTNSRVDVVNFYADVEIDDDEMQEVRIGTYTKKEAIEMLEGMLKHIREWSK